MNSVDKLADWAHYTSEYRMQADLDFEQQLFSFHLNQLKYHFVQCYFHRFAMHFEPFFFQRSKQLMQQQQQKRQPRPQFLQSALMCLFELVPHNNSSKNNKCNHKNLDYNLMGTSRTYYNSYRNSSFDCNNVSCIPLFYYFFDIYLLLTCFNLLQFVFVFHQITLKKINSNYAIINFIVQIMEPFKIVDRLKRKIIDSQVEKSNQDILQLIQNYQPQALKANKPTLNKNPIMLPFETYIYPVIDSENNKNNKQTSQQQLTIQEGYYQNLETKILEKINQQTSQYFYDYIKAQLQEQIYLNQQKRQIKTNQLKTLEGIVEEIDRNKQIQKLIAVRNKKQNEQLNNNENDAKLNNALNKMNDQTQQGSNKTQQKNTSNFNFKKRTQKLSSTPCFQIHIDHNQSQLKNKSNQDNLKKIKKISIPLRLDKVKKEDFQQQRQRDNSNQVSKRQRQKEQQKVYSLTLRSHGGRTYRKLNYQENIKNNDRLNINRVSNQEVVGSSFNNQIHRNNQKHSTICNMQKHKTNQNNSIQLQERLRQVAYYQIQYYKNHEEQLKAQLKCLQSEYQNKFQVYEYRKKFDDLNQKLILIRKKLKILVQNFWKSVPIPINNS